MTITTRAAKGSELTHAELDGNFTDLDARATAAATHAAASAPHAGHLTQTQADARYVRSVNGVAPDAAGDVAAVTNISVTLSPTQAIIVSSDGWDATLPAADATNAGLMVPSQVSKLAGVAAGATANATDAQLRDRSTHTGAQPIATVTGLQAALDAKMSAPGTVTAAQVLASTAPAAGEGSYVVVGGSGTVIADGMLVRWVAALGYYTLDAVRSADGKVVVS